MATTKIADVIVPEIFTPYAQLETMERSVLIQSGAVTVSPSLNSKLAGGGSVFTDSFWDDLDNTESNISTDDEADKYTGGSNDSVPLKTGARSEVQIRQVRNQSWAASKLTALLAGSDPMASIGARVGAYWARDLQRSFVATMNGVFADNDAAPATDEHVQSDLSNDISGATYEAGVTDIGSGAFIDTTVTMGDAMGDLTLMMVHSIVFSRLQKQNLIEFIPASDGKIMIPTYLGRAIVMDDNMPNTDGVYDTWLFGTGAVMFGQNAPDNATATDTHEDAGNGGGEEVLYNRTQRILHPTGHKWVGAIADGGPSNAEQANAASWERAYPERKQIRIARLVTREHAAA